MPVRAEAVAADVGEEPGFLGAAHDHAPRILARHAIAGELLAAAALDRDLADPSRRSCGTTGAFLWAAMPAAVALGT